MKIPIKAGVKGHVKATLTDVRDGSTQVVDKDNLLLDDFWDAWFENNISFLNSNTMHQCYIGSGTSGPTVGDTSVENELANSTNPTTMFSPSRAGEDRLGAPEDLPAGDGRGFAWSHDSTYLAVAHSDGDHLTWYKRDGDTLSKLDAPEDLPAGNGDGCAWSHDSTYLAVAHRYGEHQ